jgi:hypothetical protein
VLYSGKKDCGLCYDLSCVLDPVWRLISNHNCRDGFDDMRDAGGCWCWRRATATHLLLRSAYRRRSERKVVFVLFTVSRRGLAFVRARGEEVVGECGR